MIFYWFCITVGLVMFILFMKYRCKKPSAEAAVLKAMTSVFFILTGLFAMYGKSDVISDIKFGLFAVGGLCFGMLGDIWLDLKFVHRDNEEIYTYAGFYSFAIGHTLYIGGLVSCFGDKTKPLYIIIPVILGIVVGCSVVLGGKLLKLNFGKYKAVSMFYGSILISMAFLSFSLALMNGFKNMTLDFIAVGGVFFLISDLILSGTYFGEGKDRSIDIFTNHLTYYIAQYLIASSLLFLK